MKQFLIWRRKTRHCHIDKVASMRRRKEKWHQREFPTHVLSNSKEFQPWITRTKILRTAQSDIFMKPIKDRLGFWDRNRRLSHIHKDATMLEKSKNDMSENFPPTHCPILEKIPHVNYKCNRALIGIFQKPTCLFRKNLLRINYKCKDLTKGLN